MEKKHIRRLYLALVIILLANLMACGLQTGFGKVRVQDMYLTTDQQQNLHALAFIPRNASAENKLPCIIAGHGGFHSAEMQDAACIELSRRGFVVIAIDMYSHGMSSNVPVSVVASESEVGLGMADMVEYVAQGNMDFVDTERIGVIGHSMGARSIVALMKNYSAAYDAAIAAAQDPDSAGGCSITAAEQARADSEIPIVAAFCEGKSPNLLSGKWADIRNINIAFEYGIYEEDCYSSGSGDGHILNTPEALEMINSVDPSVTSVEDGKYYGNVQDRTLRVLYQPKTTHLTDFIDPTVTSQFISFFTYVFDVNTLFSPGNQIYLIKELFNFAAMIALFALVLPFGDMFISVPALAVLRCPGETGRFMFNKKRFWTGWVLGGLFSFLGFLVSNAIDTDKVIFKSSPMASTTWFPLNEMNIVMVWMLIFAVWNFVWYFICRRQLAEEGAYTGNMSGLRISGRELFLTIVAAAAIVGLIYVVVWFSKWLFNVDFRFWRVAVKQFNSEKLIYFAQYLPSWFVFMLSASLLVNGPLNMEGKNGFGTLLLIGVGFALGGIVAWALQYGKLFIGGTVFWSNMNGVASVALKNWVMILTPFMLRNFYKLTGKNWLGPITLSVLFTLINVSMTTIQYPML